MNRSHTVKFGSARGGRGPSGRSLAQTRRGRAMTITIADLMTRNVVAVRRQAEFKDLGAEDCTSGRPSRSATGAKDHCQRVAVGLRRHGRARGPRRRRRSQSQTASRDRATQSDHAGHFQACLDCSYSSPDLRQDFAWAHGMVAGALTLLNYRVQHGTVRAQLRRDGNGVWLSSDPY